MVPDIALQKRQQKANSLDSSATSSPLTDSSVNSPSPPDSFSSTSSPESRSSSVSSHFSQNSSSSTRRYLNSTFLSQNQNGYCPQKRNSSQGSLSLQNSLPINLVKNQLMKNIQQHDSVIIIGETGCGKTTQIPKFIYEFYTTRQYSQPMSTDSSQFFGLIGITQPRRVAAVSIANRVTVEMEQTLGDLIGYTIRFEDQTSSRTRIKYMTDGILLREAISDPSLSKYRFIILDEAHERTVHTDVLFGVVKKAQRLRNLKRDSLDGKSHKFRQLKLIIMSATMDVDHFSKYFNGAPVYYIVGRTFPIETFYMQAKQTDYVSSALSTIFQIHQQEDEIEHGFDKDSIIGGDIIVFCTGQDEIESMIKIVVDLSSQLNSFKTRSGHLKTLKPYPLYAALPNSVQQKIFSRSPDDCFRRVIFATNIAETSVTIPNIRFVVDTGKVKSRLYSPNTGFEVMQIENISRAQACQRSGRAGRLAPGQCYRLYTKKEFKQMKPFPIPDIQKCNLSNVMLQLMAIGIQDVGNFDFVDPPSNDNIEASIRSLKSLKAIEPIADLEPNLYKLTEMGSQMITFPVDPNHSALIIASRSFHCTDEILIIISMLSIDSVFYVPSGEREQALKMHDKFSSSEGDLIKLLNIYRRYRESKQSREWCRENYLRPVQLKMAVEIRNQLAELCNKINIPVVGCGNNTEQLRKCLALGSGLGIGFGANVALLQRNGDYRILYLDPNNKPKQLESSDNSRTVFIHPSSCLFSSKTKPECILFAELVRTTKSYMRNVCIVDQQWLLDYKKDGQ
ncbi:putative ATP-dependent RNA helicase dhx33 [Blomia tropicalis]|nr:putative ATP-dependent RNA helicase dhx33 [Blomia tropicalis]